MSADSKACVMKTIAREPAGRIPCDFHASPAVVDRLCDAFGIRRGLKPLLGYLGSDIVDIRGTADPLWIAGFPQKWSLPNGDLRSYLGFTTRVVEPPFGPEEEHVKGALEDAESLEDVLDFPYPSADWFDYKNLAEDLKPYEEFCVMASGPSYFQHPSFLRGIENLLCDYLITPDIAEYIVGKFRAYYLEHIRRMLDAADGCIDLVRIADDLGTQQAPLMSLAVARQFLFPHVKALCDLAHGYGAKVMMHSCGSVESFFDDIIACGVDVIDPLQPRAAGMDFPAIYEKYHRRVCLHGSVDTQYTLPNGTPDEVRREVLSRLEAAPEGAFIIAPAHVVKPDVPPENVRAMYETIRQFNGDRA